MVMVPLWFSMFGGSLFRLCMRLISFGDTIMGGRSRKFCTAMSTRRFVFGGHTSIFNGAWDWAGHRTFEFPFIFTTKLLSVCNKLHALLGAGTAHH